MEMDNKTKFFRADALVLCILVSISLLIFAPGTASAKSLYVISDITAPRVPIQAYDIAADGMVALQGSTFLFRRMIGPSAITMDSDSQTLFVSYAYLNLVSIVDATRMDNNYSDFYIEGAADLGSVAYDHDKKRLYCFDKGRNKLYVNDWDSEDQTLTAVVGSPFVLSGVTARGIAIDEIDDMLYISNGNYTVYAYSTSDWTLKRTITLSRKVDVVAVDIYNGYLYAGGGNLNNKYLTQYHLISETEKEIQVEVDSGVVGLGVDSDTGYVFMTTGLYYAEGGDNLLVYNKNLTRIGFVKDIGNPAGLVVPGNESGYNPLNLNVVAASGVSTDPITGITRLEDKDGLITYNICFDSIEIGTSLSDVVVVDTLPTNATFISADDDSSGKYDALSHTYTWIYPAMAAGASKCLGLTVQVNKNLPPGTLIKNIATINSNQTPPSTRAVKVYKTSNPINITKSIVGAASGTTKLVDPGEVLTYRISFNTLNSQYTATGVTIEDKLPEEVKFVSADYDSTLGSYDLATHTYKWSHPDLVPGASGHVDIVVKVKSNVSPGTLITNTATINSNETPASSSSVNIKTNKYALDISKNVEGAFYNGATYTVSNGDVLTYNISFGSSGGTYNFTEVTITDTLPEEVTFISAGSGGIYNQYEHACTWSFPVIEPDTTTNLQIVVRVSNSVPLETVITNIATLACNENTPVSASVGVVVQQSPLEATYVQFIPNILRRYNGTVSEIAAVVQLPKGYTSDDLLGSSLVLNYGSTNLYATRQDVYDTENGAKLVAVFQKDQILDAIPGYGSFNIRLIGEFESGRLFYGDQEIWITRFTGY